MVLRKYIGLLLMTLTMIAIMSAGNTVMANGPLMERCDFVDASGNINPNGLSLQVVRDSAGNWPTNLESTYSWIYQITGNISGINQLTALETVCSPPMPELGYSVLNGGQVISPGSGDPTTGFGLNNWQEYVVRLAAAPDGDPSHYGFLTARAGSFRNTSMQIKMGKSLYYCRNIIGPECYQPRIAATTTQKISLDPNHPEAFLIVTLRTDGSVVSVVDETGTPLQFNSLSDVPLTVNGQPVTYMPDGSIMKTGENSCYTYFTAGRYVQRCY